MTLELGILLALLCAMTTNLGFFYKHRGACSVARVDLSHPLRSGRALFASRWFTIGMMVATVAWIFHVAALAIAPMSVVQVVLAGGVVLIAVMGERVFGYEVGPRQWAGLTLTAVGLVLLAITLPASRGAHSQFSWLPMFAFEAGLFGIGGMLVIGRRVHSGIAVEHHGVMLGAAAGILYGVSDIALKALTGIIGAHGVVGLLTSPCLAIAVAASIVGFYAAARGLQDGQPIPVIAVTGSAANITGIAGGLAVFGDPMPGTALGITLQALAFILVIVASALTPSPARVARTAVATA